MNEVNNKLAESEINRIRLQDFNTQLIELKKGADILESVKKDNEKDIESQKAVFKEKNTDGKPSNKVTNNDATIKDKKCWHFENGFCKKGNFCDYLHPNQLCHNYKRFGECPQGLVCPLRHPLNICMDYLENRCRYGDLCVLQHPTSLNSNVPSGSSSPIYPTPTTIYSSPPPPFNQVQPQYSFLGSPSHPGTPPQTYPMPQTNQTQLRSPPQPVYQPPVQMSAGYHRGGPRGGQRVPCPPRAIRPRAPTPAGNSPQAQYRQPGQGMMFRSQLSPGQATQQQGYW